MSRLTEEILEVLEEVRDNYRSADGDRSLKTLRSQADVSVAVRRDIDRTTVSDKYRRGLRPEINGTPDFDQHLEDWLTHGSDRLRSIIIRHASDPEDIGLIDSFFYDVPEADLLLAQEFQLDPSEESFREGRAHLRRHLTRERNRSLVLKAKQMWLQEYGGEPSCAICGFSFLKTYGAIGSGFIEAHHVRPISSLEPDPLVTVDDLVPVCSDCHSILHRFQPWPTVEELRDIVKRQRDGGSASHA